MATDSSNGGIMIKPEVVLDGRTGLSEEARHPSLDWSSVTCGRGHPSHSGRFAITLRGRASELESGSRNFERLWEFSCGEVNH